MGLLISGFWHTKAKKRKPRDQGTARILGQGAGSVENIWKMEGDEHLNMIICLDLTSMS